MYRILKLPFHRALTLALIFTALLAGAPVVANAQDLLWSDEFDSGSAPNPNVWTADLGNWGWGNNELQNYTSNPANLRVENDNLVITAQKSGSGAGASFTSARVKTLDKLTVKYGTIEARIKVPDLGNGLWPAFWTLGNNFPQVGWPVCGELDIMEMGHGSAINAGVVNSFMGSAAHWDNNGYSFYGLTYQAPVNLNDDFHIFRMEWTPNYVSTYVDGNLVWSMDISSTAQFSEYHAPHFILLNLAVGGSFTGIESPAGITAPFPAEYLIDYVRIYDNGHTVLGGSSQGGGNSTSTLVDNGSTTLDTATGLEWLDLTLTQGVTAQDVLAGYGGYIADGWAFATVDEVCGLLGAMGDDTTGCTSGAVGVPMGPANAATLVNLLGNTAATGRGAYGMFNNISGFPDNAGLGCINDTATSCTGGSSSWLTLIGWASGYQTVGSFLVRPTSTAPSTLIDNGPTTLDTATGLEWLDLTLTQGVSSQDVLAGYGGYIADGWAFATVDEVCGLLGALGDDTTGCTTGAVGVPMDSTHAKTFVDLLGSTAASGRGAYGMFNDPGGFPGNAGLGCINDTATSCTGGGSSSWLTLMGWASGYQTVGSFLVRSTSTPPPPTATLIDNGSTTLDTASGLEWLDLTLTQGVSSQDVLAGYGGYIAAGWAFATVDEVCGLLGALGDDTTDCTSGAVGVSMDPANAATLVNLLGNTAATGRGAYGMFNNISGFPDNAGLGCINDTATSCTGGGSGSWLTLIGWASGYQTVGSFLVRPASDADGDGVIDASDQCPGTPAGTPVDAVGC